MVATTQSWSSEMARTLRLSISGECNLSCFYCKSTLRAQDLIQPKNLIQPSDVSKLVKIVGEMGVNRVVIEGGEPLLRKDAASFVKAAYAHRNIQDVRLVTNGTYLKAHADALKKLGLRKVDVNFDSLDFQKFQAITRRDDLFRVLDGIEKVEKLKFSSIRLNVFLLQGINHDEIIEFARMTKDRKLLLRLIEYVPLAPHLDPHFERVQYSVLQAKRKIDNFQRLVRDVDLDGDFPLPTFGFANSRGRIAFLSASEIALERSVPRVVFSADGVLFHEQMPNRGKSIVEELRKDAKQDKLHRQIEKILAMHLEETKSDEKEVSLARASRVTKKKTVSRAAAAKRARASKTKSRGTSARA